MHWIEEKSMIGIDLKSGKNKGKKGTTPLASLSPIITESVAKPEIERVMIEFDGGINKNNAEEEEETEPRTKDGREDPP